MSAENINSHFFEGEYKFIWKLYIPEGLTIAENAFILQECQLKPGDTVLDIMCGYGRNTLGLARQGIAVTAIDNCKAYIDEIQETAAAENLSVICMNSDVLQADYNKTFDAAICLGNSFSFFDAADTAKLLKNTATHLRPGGKLVVQTMMIKEISELTFTEESSGTTGPYTLVTMSRWLQNPERIESDFSITREDGYEEKRVSIDYIFTYAEVVSLFKAAGLEIIKVYSIPGRKEFAVGDKRAYFVAEKKG